MSLGTYSGGAGSARQGSTNWNDDGAGVSAATAFLAFLAAINAGLVRWPEEPELLAGGGVPPEPPGCRVQ